MVSELRVKVASEWKLATLRVLGGKNVNKRLPSALRNAEGHPVKMSKNLSSVDKTLKNGPSKNSWKF